MKDINDVIAEVVKRTGLSEDQVNAVVRSAASDCREFMESKKGYSIYFPRLGTFVYRVTAIKDYVQRQRKYLAYWKYRLDIGVATNKQRTIDAANTNIAQYKEKILASLNIKKEFINDHSRYDKFRYKILVSDTVTDIGRLDELLNVEDLKAEFEKRYKGKAGNM